MPRFAVHTEETVHGVYHVEADDADDAKRKFSEEPESLGHPLVYEAITAEVESVEPV